MCRTAERPNTEVIAGDDIWIDPGFEKVPPRNQELRATVWFDRQFPADGTVWLRRTAEFSSWKDKDGHSAWFFRFSACLRRPAIPVRSRVPAGSGETVVKRSRVFGLDFESQQS